MCGRATRPCMFQMCAARMLCTLACLLALSVGVWACNEAVCASLVSKCMLLQSCECNLMDTQNCTCCKACHLCLARLYTECCSCVGTLSQKQGAPAGTFFRCPDKTGLNRGNRFCPSKSIKPDKTYFIAL